MRTRRRMETCQEYLHGQRNGKSYILFAFRWVVFAGRVHMVSRKDLNSAELDTVRISKSPTTVVTSSSELRTRKQKIKMKDAKKYNAIYCITCLTGCRSSERIWLMNVVLQSHEKTLSLDIETLPFPLMSCQWSREQKWNRVRASMVSSLIFRKTQNCDICLKTKITRASCRWRAGTVVPRAEHFGVFITADHKVLSEESECRNNHRYAVVVQDLATQWIQAYPCKTKTSQETQRSLQKFQEPERKPKVIYTDNSLEFGKACEDLSWNHCTSTPHRSETNGIAERAVRRVKEDTSAVLLQSGLNESWWADSMECYTYLRNVTDLLSDGKTPYERRFGQPFKGPIIPFGSFVEYHPKTAKDQSRIHQFGKKVLPGLFLGYALYAGCIWKGDVLVADLEELETMDASEIYSKRLHAERGDISQTRRIYFSNRRWTNQKPLEEIGNWEHPPWYGRDQFKERVILTFLENQKGLFHNLTTHFRMPQ